MAKPWISRKLLYSRTGLYVSAALLATGLLGAIAAVRLWTVLGNAALLLSLVLASTVFGIAGTTLMVPRTVAWARARGIRLPLASMVTLQGLVFVGLILLVAGAALFSGNNLVYLVLSAMLAATLMSGLVSRLNLAGLQLSLGMPDHIFAGSPTLARVGLTNLKSLIPSFAVRIRDASPGDEMVLQSTYFPIVASRESAAASVDVLFTRRGRYKGSSVDLVTRFPFGLVERCVNLKLTDRIAVYPSVEMTPMAERALETLRQTALSRAVGESHDLYRVRPAVPGDPARLIHWKASAGSPDLWIREFTRETRFAVRLVLDRRASTPARFEAVVAACAAAAWKLTREGADVTLASDERLVVCRSPEQIYELLGYLALVERDEGAERVLPATKNGETEYVFRAVDLASRSSSLELQGAPDMPIARQRNRGDRAVVRH